MRFAMHVLHILDERYHANENLSTVEKTKACNSFKFARILSRISTGSDVQSMTIDVTDTGWNAISVVAFCGDSEKFETAAIVLRCFDITNLGRIGLKMINNE
jgi:hypothetical protein